MPQQPAPGGPPRPQITQAQAQPPPRLPTQLIASGARLSLPPSGSQLSQHIINTTPLVQVTRIGQGSTGQPITTHVVAPKQLQIPKLAVGKSEAIHTVSIGQSDTPVTSSHITHLLSCTSSLVAPLGQHVSLSQAPQRVTIQTMGQGQNPVSTQPMALTLTPASSSQANIGQHNQHVNLVSNPMSIICGTKGSRLTSQPQLLQTFSPRPGTTKPMSGNIIRASSHSATSQPQPAVLSHFSGARGPIITPIRTATISNRPNSPAVPHSAGLSITVPSSQLADKYRAMSANPGIEINVPRTPHDGRTVMSHSGTTKIQLTHNPHAAGQKIVMATTTIPPGSHPSITVAMSKSVQASHIVANALISSNVNTVTTASLSNPQTIPIAKVTPQRLQITQQQLQQHHEAPVCTYSSTTLYVPPRPVSNITAASSSSGTSGENTSGKMFYSIGGQYDPHQFPNLGPFQVSSNPQNHPRPMLVAGQPSVSVAASVSTSLSLQATSNVAQNQPRLNQVVMMEPSRPIQVRTGQSANQAAPPLQTVHIPIQSSTQIQPQSPANGVPQSPSSGTPSASPRPSILRKRANDGYPAISKKALPFTMDSSRPEQVSSPKSQSQMSIDSQHNREASQSSTDTASSREGSTNSTPTTTEMKVKLETEECEPLPNLLLRDGTSSVEASPRKKPRKQLLQANQELKDEMANSSSSEEEPMPEEPEIKEEIKEEIKDERVDEEGVRWVAYRKRPDFTLMNHYSCTWKTKNNHFLRYSDVRAKDERRPTVNELSNQKHIMQKSSGWKLYHIAAQLDDLMVLEDDVKVKMAHLQEELAPEGQSSHYGGVLDDVSMIHELTQANIQRSQLIVDQIKEAKQSMLNLLEHRKKIDEIVTKHRSRRPVKSKARL